MIEGIILMTLVTGGVYALLSSGFSLIFGVARVLNMAHTAFYMLAAFGIFYLISQVIGIEMNFILAMIIVVVVVTLLGMLSYKLFINPIREHPGAVLLVTIALAMAIEQILIMVFREDIRSVRFLIPGSIELLGMRISNQYLLTLGTAVLIIIIIQLLLSKTKLGIAIRAVANDTEIANLMGMSVSRILLLTMGIATFLAGVAGVLMAPLITIYPTMWGSPLMTVMVIVVLGGLGSIRGSLIGAFIIAFVGALCVFDPLRLIGGGGAYLNMTFIMLAMVIVLIVRPGGLFGVLFEEERL